jgi:hypothetical protein
MRKVARPIEQSHESIQRNYDKQISIRGVPKKDSPELVTGQWHILTKSIYIPKTENRLVKNLVEVDPAQDCKDTLIRLPAQHSILMISPFVMIRPTSASVRVTLVSRDFSSTFSESSMFSSCWGSLCFSISTGVRSFVAVSGTCMVIGYVS